MAKHSATHNERDIMYYYGTMKWKPTPSTLIETARRDLLISRENARIERDKREARKAGANARLAGTKQKTGFLASHVNGSTSELQLLEKALANASEGIKSHNVATRYLYDETTLSQAIEQLRRTGGSR